MQTLSEFLKTKENQAFTLERIIQVFRRYGAWGKRGLFTTISTKTGFSPAYAGQVLNGKKVLTEQFVEKISVLLEMPIKDLLAPDEWEEVKFEGMVWPSEEDQLEARRLGGLTLSDPLMKEGAQILERFTGEYREKAVEGLRKLAKKAEKLGQWAPFPKQEKEE